MLGHGGTERKDQFCINLVGVRPTNVVRLEHGISFGHASNPSGRNRASLERTRYDNQ